MVKETNKAITPRRVSTRFSARPNALKNHGHTASLTIVIRLIALAPALSITVKMTDTEVAVPDGATHRLAPEPTPTLNVDPLTVTDVEVKLSVNPRYGAAPP